jgi:RNA polymerase sigma-70 factor (ECF subfamily)
VDDRRELPGSFQPDRSEELLLDRVRAGDRAALDLLCRREWRPLYRIIAASIPRQAEAEELTQEVFTRALASLPSYRYGGVPFEAYLAEIARNLIRDRWRREQALSVVESEVPDQVSIEAGPEELAEAAYLHQRLTTALDRLSPEHRQILKLRVVEKRSAGEVAELLGRSPDAVRQLQHRAMVALRAVFDDPVGALR